VTSNGDDLSQLVPSRRRIWDWRSCSMKAAAGGGRAIRGNVMHRFASDLGHAVIADWGMAHKFMS
jgi:hypothetical protein